jgi:hypothetical protein
MHDWRFFDARVLGQVGARGLPDSQGVRVLAQRRHIAGALAWTNGPPNVNGTGVRWAPRITFGYPCWLPPYPCRWLSRRS